MRLELDHLTICDNKAAVCMKETYSGMSDLEPASPVIERGISLHKMIHFITMALGGEGYLNFMGNEFGHPEWIDFPRDGNRWSYDKCRRQWNLVDTDHLRYKYMNAFDRAMNLLDDRFSFLASTKQIVSSMNEKDKIIVFERGDLVFVFNFHPENSYDGYKVGCDLPGKYRVALDSDALEFGGLGRIGNDVDHFTSPEGIPGVPETNFNNRPNSFKVLAPSRTCVVFYRVEEDLLKENNAVDVVDTKEDPTRVAEVIAITNENPDMVDAKEDLTKVAEDITITTENPDMVDAKEDLTKVAELIAIIDENPDMVITKEDLTKVAEVIAIINENPDMVVTKEDLTKVAEVIAIINENPDMINTKQNLSKVAKVIAIINENPDMIDTKEDLTKVAEVIAFTNENPDIVDTKEVLTKVVEVITITDENPTGVTESIVATKDPSRAIIDSVITGVRSEVEDEEKEDETATDV